FLSAFFRFFLRHAQSPSRLLNKEARPDGLGLSNRRRGIAAAGMLNGVGPRGEVLVEHIAVEPDAAFPGDRRRVRIDADLLELAHIAPQLESADLEQIAEEHAALESVLEAQPQFVVLLGLACRNS